MEDAVWDERINECKEIFSEKLTELNKNWPEGCFKWAKENEPSLYSKAFHLDERMNGVWLDYAEGRTNLEAVRGFISLWFETNSLLARHFEKKESLSRKVAQKLPERERPPKGPLA